MTLPPLPPISSLTRTQGYGHPGQVLWFTGLSGAGKTSLSAALESVLFARGCHTFLLDGDRVRHGLCADLGFSAPDRAENLRRVAEVAKLACDAGMLVLSAFISPCRADREHVRHIIGAERFLEIHVDSPLSVCEQRDVKGLYRRARAGEIADFTGISAPYESPLNPSLRLNTAQTSLQDCIAHLMALLGTQGIIQPV